MRVCDTALGACCFTVGNTEQRSFQYEMLQREHALEEGTLEGKRSKGLVPVT
jgi:hypothetical protein